MSSPMDVFRVTGPSHLTSVDWKNTHHRRAIAASLVEGAYKIERDRQENRQGPQAEAPPYWEFFHFNLNHVLIDHVDHSFFGAVYEFKYPSYPDLFPTNDTVSKPPKYVVALRGTLTQPDTRSRDLKLDLQCILNRIHHSSRVQLATQTIHRLVSVAGAGNVWLAGHSLGSAIGLLAGKSMARMGLPLETYLFNPPFISAPIERIKEERVRNGIRIAGSVMKAGLSAVVKDGRPHRHHHRQSQSQAARDWDSFAALSGWFPYLFVNPADHICSGYIGYFEHRKKMEEIGAGGIGRLATMSSVESILSGAMGKDSEPYDLIPSALLTVNQTPSPDFRRAHGVEQWWNPNFHYRSLTYQFTH
ncbi:Fungal lipase-like domain containing protein [Parasponia andersonii]|uniref:Fungal lipase-like domain containing protein n=1 Tax=Parasponia andersonii TaxID=3476 RepID=A0A2P5DFJ9_PARAD|nr:Fungal lipase-like domain containing protein [Parasponia andersonii]